MSCSAYHDYSEIERHRCLDGADGLDHVEALMMRSAMQELMPGSSAEHSSSAKGSSTAQLKSWLSGLGKIGKADVEEVCFLDLMGT